MGIDLVCVFDIESGIWKGDIDPHIFTEETDETRLEKALKKILRHYSDDEWVLKEGRKITIPRYVSIGLMPWETFEKGCYEDPELAFLYTLDRYTFCLGENGVDDFLLFWQDLLEYTRDKGNILLMAHNANYDTGGILNACKTENGNRLVDMTRSYIAESEGSYTAFPESIHEDKTFDIKLGNHHLRLVDTLNLSPVGCKSLRKFGERATAMYQKDYKKMDTYDYDYEIRSADDLLPTDAEIAYTDRDLELCLFAGMMSIFPYRKELMGRGRRFKASDFPFSATQRDKAVNDGLAIMMEFPDRGKKFWKDRYRLRLKNFKNWCARWGNVNDPEVYEMMHKAGTGGIITCNESYVGKPVENVGSMDLGSSYPACAGDFLYPRMEYDRPYTGPLSADVFYKYLNGILIPMAMELRTGKMSLDSVCVNHKWEIGMKVGFVAKVRFHGILYHDFGKDINGKQYWLPTLPYKDFHESFNREPLKTMRGKVIDNDFLDYYVTHVGLLIILAFYDIDEIQFLDGYSYEMRLINPVIWSRFQAGLIGKQRVKKIKKDWEKGKISDDEMIELTGMGYLKGQDRKTMEDEMKAYYEASKIPVNAMYGASYRRLRMNTRVILENGSYRLGEGEYEANSAVAYPTGEYIAIYGQLKIAHAMLWAMAKKLPILYVHTDSLKIQGLTPELVKEYNDLVKEPPNQRNGKNVSFRSFGVGLMDYEGSHDISVVLGNMRIVSWDKDSGFHITMSGLNEHEAFPKEKLAKMDFFAFCSKFLDDGHKYSVNSDTSSGKTITDWTYAGKKISGVGYTMQSIIDAEFVLNNPDTLRQRSIQAVYEELVGEYHDCAWYGRRKYIVKDRSKENAKN